MKRVRLFLSKSLRLERHWIYPSIALIAFVMGLQTANIFIQYVPHSGDAAAWSGAVGTFLAFTATIWIASDQTRQKRQKELHEAILAAARIIPQLLRYRSAVTTLRLDMRIGLHEGRLIYYGPQFDEIIKSCSWATADVMPLTVLPRNVAYHLEYIKAAVPEIIASYYSICEKAGAPKGLFNELDYDMSAVRLANLACSAKFKETIARLTVVMEECAAIIPREPVEW